MRKSIKAIAGWGRGGGGRGGGRGGGGSKRPASSDATRQTKPKVDAKAQARILAAKQREDAVEVAFESLRRVPRDQRGDEASIRYRDSFLRGAARWAEALIEAERRVIVQETQAYGESSHDALAVFKKRERELFFKGYRRWLDATDKAETIDEEGSSNMQLGKYFSGQARSDHVSEAYARWQATKATVRAATEAAEARAVFDAEAKAKAARPGPSSSALDALANAESELMLSPPAFVAAPQKETSLIRTGLLFLKQPRFEPLAPRAYPCARFDAWVG